MEYKAINHVVAKKDSQALVTGQPVYTDDLRPKDCLIVKALRSPHARAIVKKVNKSAAEKVPGIVCIVTADEFDTYPPALPIRSRVNGELRQDSNTKLQIFDIDHVIHELSQGMTLKAGTIIATGTPAGVGMGMDPPQFLHPGDTVQCEIEGIGTLTNTVR